MELKINLRTSDAMTHSFSITTPEISKCNGNDQTLFLNKIIERCTIYKTCESRAALTEVGWGSCTCCLVSFLKGPVHGRVPRDFSLKAPWMRGAKHGAMELNDTTLQDQALLALRAKVIPSKSSQKEGL